MKDKIVISRTGLNHILMAEGNSGWCDRIWKEILTEAEKERATESSPGAETGDQTDDKTPEFGGSASGGADQALLEMRRWSEGFQAALDYMSEAVKATKSHDATE